MNEELQKAILNIVNASMDAVGRARDFAIEQAPDVVQQFLRWEMLHSLVNVSLSLFFGLLAVAVAVIGYKIVRFLVSQSSDKKPWTQGPSNDGFICSWIAVVIVLPALFAALLLESQSHMNTDWLHIWIAPKDYLIRAAVSMAK